MPPRRAKTAPPAHQTGEPPTPAPPADGKREVLPANIPVMLSEAGEPFDSPDHMFEIKWDGTRCCVLRRASGLLLVNRRGFELNARYPELACLDRLPPDTALDAEIVVLDQGKPSFNKLMQREHLTGQRQIQMAAERLPATLIVFDLMYRDGRNQMPRPLRERKQQLAEVVQTLASPHVVISDHILEHGRRFFESVAAAGLEGMMAKRLESQYRPGKRSRDWLKIKVATTEEFDLLGFTQREDQPVVSALIVGLPADGDRWTFLGKVGTGFTEATRAELYQLLAPRPVLKRPPPDGPKDGQWRITNLRCRVRYLEKTNTGKLRGPVYEGLVPLAGQPPAGRGRKSR